MATSIRIAAALVAAVFLVTPAAWAGDDKPKGADTQQSQPAASPGTPSKAPDRWEGEVVSIDLDAGMMTLRMPDGSTQQFRGDRETLKDYKIGDRVEGKLRQPAR